MPFEIGHLDENGVYYANSNLPGMTKTWPNVNPRYGPKPVPTDLEAHAVAATAFIVMTYTHRARVKDAEPLGTALSELFSKESPVFRSSLLLLL